MQGEDMNGGGGGFPTQRGRGRGRSRGRGGPYRGGRGRGTPYKPRGGYQGNFPQRSDTGDNFFTEDDENAAMGQTMNQAPVEKYVLKRENFHGFFNQVYAFKEKKLNLSSLSTNETLLSALPSVYSPPNLNSEIFVKELLHVVPFNTKNHCEELDLSNNSIVTLQGLKNLKQNFPKLTRLNLSQNQLQTIQELSNVITLSLKSLNLLGNPLLQTFGQKSQYVSELKNLFPQLEVIDGEKQATGAFAAVAKKEAILPPPNVNSSIENSILEPVQGFLIKYYEMFDKNRNNLFTAYKDDATFSLSIGRHQGYGAPNADFTAQEDKLHTKFLQHSRNVKFDMREDPLKKGKISIVNFFVSNFPPTEHANKEKFIFDCNLITVPPRNTPLATLSVHGEVKLLDDNTILSFDRMFVLSPPEGQGEWPMLILNDQLHLRAHTPLDFLMNPELPLQQQQQQQQQQSLMAQTVSPEVQAQMVTALERQTNMISAYCVKCLEDCKWNYQAALDAFNRNKAALPRDAFKS